MPTSVINQRFSMDRDHLQQFVLELIRCVILIYNFCGVKVQRAWDLFYDIIFLDLVTTRHISQFQLMWPHRRSKTSPLLEWWAAFHTYMGEMCVKPSNQRNNSRLENPWAFGDQVKLSNQQTTSSGKVKRTSERFPWHGCVDLRGKIDLPSCWQYKTDDFLAIRPLNWDEKIDKDNDEENWADPGARSGGSSRPADGNDNDDGQGERTMQGGEKGTREGKGTKDGKGKGKVTADGQGKGKGKGKGKGNGKGKGIVKQTLREMITPVPLLCSCRRKFMRQTLTRRANWRGYI